MLFRPRGSKKQNDKAKIVFDEFAKVNPGFLSGPITQTGVRDKVQVVERPGPARSWAPRRTLGKGRTERFRKPTGELTVPTGTMVYVHRRIDIEDDKGRTHRKGWFKYHLTMPRTFQEHHQITTMNPGLLRTNFIKILSNKQWIVFHTEEKDFPLIAFSAFSDEFPLKRDEGVHPLGEQPKEAFPFSTPIRYPPHGNTFDRLFNQQKVAFLNRYTFKAGFKSKKQLDSDE